MRVTRSSRILTVGLLTASLVGLTACGAGSRTGAETATKVACDFENPAQPTTINVLAYNSSAVDPYSNTMV
jgi:multiple sugar transport system substrate-binding protein